MRALKIVFQKFVMRMMEWLSGCWVCCFVPEHSQVMGFCVIDKETTIGDYVFIGRFCEITKARIGRYVSIASGVKIGSGEHQFERMTTSSYVTGHVARDLSSGPCLIGNDVWIGTDAFIKRGVTVGDGAVIGAHTVVTKDVPPFAIVVGNPARVIKYRFTPEQCSRLQKECWWKLELHEAKSMYEKFSSSLTSDESAGV